MPLLFMTELKNGTKTSITQRLQIDLERSVGVATAIQLMWLNWFFWWRPAFLLTAGDMQKQYMFMYHENKTVIFRIYRQKIHTSTFFIK